MYTYKLTLRPIKKFKKLYEDVMTMVENKIKFNDVLSSYLHSNVPNNYFRLKWLNLAVNKLFLNKINPVSIIYRQINTAILIDYNFKVEYNRYKFISKGKQC